jgi:hypothetical protein
VLAHSSVMLILALAVSALLTLMPSSSSGRIPDSITTTRATLPAMSPLTCSGGSTVLTTTDCTVGNTISYCYRSPPPIQCPTSSFPGVWHPEHCVAEQTCYPIDAPWITTECSHGGILYSTSTLYEGTLAGGNTTTITGKSDLVSCLGDVPDR